mgnify:CR=1 FL=1
MIRDYFWLSAAQFAKLKPLLLNDTRGKPTRRYSRANRSQRLRRRDNIAISVKTSFQVGEACMARTTRGADTTPLPALLKVIALSNAFSQIGTPAKPTQAANAAGSN